MQLLHVKFNNGEDIVTYGQISEDRRSVKIKDPLQIIIDPHNGFFVRNWLMLSENDSVVIPSNKILTIGVASETAVKYYNEYLKRMQSRKEEDVFEDNSDIESLEELFTSLLESKTSIKH